MNVLAFLQNLAKETERYQDRELVDYGTENERYEFVEKTRPTSDAVASKRILTLMGYEQ